jgi:hydroxymethylbilane synthase
MPADRPILLATRGSPLALAQAHSVAAACRRAFPGGRFELLIVKTTGDKLQRASLAGQGESLPKGLFTKELEVALEAGAADLAVHSLKDLPTDLPPGLELGAVLERADPRDVLVSRDPDVPIHLATAEAPRPLPELGEGAVLATSSTRRREQVRALRSDVVVVEIRGNVHTRLRKLAERVACDATLLAAAGLFRLGFSIQPDGRLLGPGPDAADPAASPPVPEGLRARPLPVEVMVPCVGQAAIGLERRAGDDRLAEVCARLNHRPTFQCVTAERTFLRTLGGGCQSPVAALAEVVGDELRMRGVSFREGPARWASVRGPLDEPVVLGEQLAAQLR